VKACNERASAYNLQFLVPLDENEVIGIAKSIAKWTHRKFDNKSFEAYIKKTHSKEIQSIRGIKSGLSRRKGSIEEESPWVAMGISRRKYFYDKKNNEKL